VTGLPVRLELLNGAVLEEQVTDGNARFFFEGVPSGRVRVVADSQVLGDSLSTFGPAFSEPILLFAGGDVDVAGGLIYPIVAVPEVRQLAQGKTVFTSGLALNSLGAGVDDLHIAATGGFLRITDAVGVGVQIGDSVRVRGQTGRDAGQPILRLGRPFNLGPSIRDVEATRVSTAEADEALGGALDAAFVRVDPATVISAQDLDVEGTLVVVDDGSGPIEVIFREFLGVRPDDVVIEEAEEVRFTRLRGLLVPYEDGGDTRWALFPRNGSDFRIDVTLPPPEP
jgi:hypothetical protein